MGGVGGHFGAPDVPSLLVAAALALALLIPPAPTARVNDYANALSADERGRLERFLAEREAATGAQMAVAIFRSAEGESIDDVSIKLAERWRIGQKGLDNGVILVVFLTERRVRLEVGYGLEPTIPDAVAAGIIRDVIAPRFREGRYAAGIEAAARAVYERAGEGKADGRARRSRGTNFPIIGFFVLFGIMALIFAWETMSLQRRQRRLHYTLGSQGPYVPMGPTWGGFMGGGGFGGGGGGGGGGGFSGGGGSFGGGGASGEW